MSLAQDNALYPFKRYAEMTASILLETKAVMLSPDKPFTLTSGRQSPVYVDCRRLIAFPRARAQLMDMGVSLINHHVGYDKIDVVAGGETAGIPFATMLAERMNLPLCYIRKKPKGFGRNARIEGNVTEGQTALMVEDMTTDGGSKLSFIDGLRDAGAVCNHCFVIFQYGIFPDKMKQLEAHDLSLFSLADWWDVLAIAKARQSFNSQQFDNIERFLNSPLDWQA
ncbi:MAG: orotate phosphoribosyltransferase [Alphaproteobacteria bacterium]